MSIYTTESSIQNIRVTNTETFITKSKLIHGDAKFDYSLVNYVKSKEKVTIICKTHGEFSQLPMSHLSGHGCKWCSSTSTALLQRKTTEKFINEIIQIHGTYWHSDPRKHHSNQLHKRKKITHGENYSQSCQKDQDWL